LKKTGLKRLKRICKKLGRIPKNGLIFGKRLKPLLRRHPTMRRIKPLNLSVKGLKLGKEESLPKW